MMHTSAQHPSFGFNVIGYLSGNLGLGVSARHLTKLLVDKGHPIAVLDLDPGVGRGRHDTSFERYTVPLSEELPHPINLAMIAIPTLPAFLLDPPRIIGSPSSLRPGSHYWFANDRLNAAVVWWELSVLPDLWIKALETFDVLIAPSPYIRATLETHLSGPAIVSATHPFSVPAGIEISRARFGLPEDAVLFVTSFEPMSDPERKNPFAAIEAFRRAFAGDARANLIIKLNNAQMAGGALSPNLVRLREIAASDARIRVIEETLSYADVLALYASCDVFVSLHRSEGFGFGLLEMMAFGKPVIATGWSGNMAFMNHSNSCLVGYTLVPVEPTLPVYSKEFLGRTATWADADVDEAAAWMKKLIDDPPLRKAIGARAADAVVAFQHEAQQARFVDEIRAIWETRAFLPPRRDTSRAAALQDLRRARAQQPKPAVPYGKRLHDKIRDAADKHLLWRFK